jgi:hypothetical protein
MPAAILSLSADVVVLTEYVPAEGDAFLREGLPSGGLEHIYMSARSVGHNQVLIVTRAVSELGEPLAREPASHAASNYLHIRLSLLDADIIGLRVPMYTRSADKRDYWDWLESACSEWIGRRMIILGDFNADYRSGPNFQN